MAIHSLPVAAPTHDQTTIYFVLELVAMEQARTRRVGTYPKGRLGQGVFVMINVMAVIAALEVD